MTRIVQQIKEKINKLKRVTWVAHLIRMHTRYSTRLGKQFAGAITYFSLLAMVPIIMFAFSACGFTLTVLRPELLERVQSEIVFYLQGAPEGLKIKLIDLISRLLHNWASVGFVGLLSSIYSSAAWAGNLKSAVRAQTRPVFDMKEQKHSFFVEGFLNFAILLGLLLILVVTFALAAMATSLTGAIVHWLGLDHMPGIGIVLRLVGPVLSAIAGWAMFVYIYKVMPEVKFHFRIIAWGSMFGSVGLFALQYLTGFLMGTFSGNPAAVLFGPVIVLMLFFNLFARLNLYVAAWIATSVQPAVADQIQEFDRPLITANRVHDDVRQAVRERLQELADKA